MPQNVRVLRLFDEILMHLGIAAPVGNDWKVVLADQSGRRASTVKEVRIEKRITPHMMRYLFNDVLRQADMDKVTRHALTGHVTDEMTTHYSYVQLDEKRAAMEAAGAKLREGKVGLLVGPAAKNREAA